VVVPHNRVVGGCRPRDCWTERYRLTAVRITHYHVEGAVAGDRGVFPPRDPSGGYAPQIRRFRRRYVVALTFDGTVVRGDGAARERFYDSRGYGRPRGSDLELAPVETAHLLFRGDLDGVEDARPETESGTRLGFQDLLASVAVSEVSFLVYAELRERGFYLSPVRETDREFVVYPRGQGPWDDAVAYRVRAVSEREDVSAATLRDLADRADDATGVLAVVDEESEVSYFEIAMPDIEGATDHDLPTTPGLLLADRVLVADPPTALHERAFYGQPLGEDIVQLSLVEAAHLADCGLLRVETDESGEGGARAAVLDRGRGVEGERFDRRLRVYSTLREHGVVPKTGFKFGADFRTYAEVESVENLGHSERLVRVLPAAYTFAPRDLALDVRLAHGVRKEIVFALTDGKRVDWLTAGRLTP
jgi:tRNA-intron endonuclease